MSADKFLFDVAQQTDANRRAAFLAGGLVLRHQHQMENR